MWPGGWYYSFWRRSILWNNFTWDNSEVSIFNNAFRSRQNVSFHTSSLPGRWRVGLLILDLPDILLCIRVDDTYLDISTAWEVPHSERPLWWPDWLLFVDWGSLRLLFITCVILHWLSILLWVLAFEHRKPIVNFVNLSSHRMKLARLPEASVVEFVQVHTSLYSW